VLHRFGDPSLVFVLRQAHLVRLGGILVGSDHGTDPDPECIRQHDALERARDRTALF